VGVADGRRRVMLTLQSMREFKPRIDEVVERYRCFWNVEKTDRPPAHLYNPVLKGWRKRLPDGWPMKWAGFPGGSKPWERLVNYHIRMFWEDRVVEDDRVPYVLPYFGPPAIAALLSPILCDLRFSGGTGWAKPLMDTWDEAENLHFDPENRWVRKLVKLTDFLITRSRGRFAVSLTDTHCTGDVMAALRGTEKLIVDLYRNPDEVKKLAAACTRGVIDILEFFLERIPHVSDGTVLEPFGIWAPGEKSCVLMEDVAANLSPEMYREFLLPYDNQVAERMDTAAFHVDGGLQIVPELLKIRKLGVVQVTNNPKWTSIIDAPEPGIEHLKKARSMGKALMVSCGNLGEARKVLKLFGPEGLCFHPFKTRSVEEGNRNLEKLTQLVKNKYA